MAYTKRRYYKKSSYYPKKRGYSPRYSKSRRTSGYSRSRPTRDIRIIIEQQPNVTRDNVNMIQRPIVKKRKSF